MKLNRVTYIILFLLPLFMHSQKLERSLADCQWKFKNKQDKKWLKATVPGTIHTDLFFNKRIPDPFFGDNEKQLQWIENEDWEYKTSFLVSKSELSQSHIELQFDGLDTYAKVFLNDSLILVADNMFRTWKVDVKKYIRKGKNKLFILFESAVKKGKEEAKKLPYTLPGDEKVFTRKAQYQYGWDWGPRFVTCGIWKNVKFISWNDAEILNVRSVQKSLTDSLAELEFICEIQSDMDANAFLEISKGNSKDVSGQRIRKIKLLKGSNTISISYNIKDPQRWWCNGLGFPTLYDFSITLSYDSKFLDAKKIKIGLRTLNLIQQKDSIGTSFYFELNGIPVFMKGANFIPPDNFLPRITKGNYQTIIKNAVDANMNMLRVWGGGTYADDEFYDECDKNGILVWQDLMFACAMYPGDDHFIANVSEEVINQVERLRNHPCIALWCGNNEVDEGWKNWEWQKQYQYSEKDSLKIWNDYANLFHKIIPNIISEKCPPLEGAGGGIYWPSSPSIGWGHKESLLQGDSHYWGVWWGMEPFGNYNQKVGRFMSEYGFQGMPDVNTVRKFGLNFSENSKSISDSTAFKNHQKHRTGYSTIDTYMALDYIIPKKIGDYVYVSQLLQAEGMKIAIEAHRRAKPYCMGTLYWQLNDCWPVTSWSSVDYYNTWKASHYLVKRSYENNLISVSEKNEQVQIHIINDGLDSLTQVLVVSLMDFKGNVLWKKKKNVCVLPNSSFVYDSISKSEFQHFDLQQSVLLMLLERTSSLNETSAFYYFAKPKELKLQKSKISFSIFNDHKTQGIALTSDVFAKDVCVDIIGESLNLSENYFDLLPNKPKIIYLPPNTKIKNLTEKIKIKSLVDTY